MVRARLKMSMVVMLGALASSTAQAADYSQPLPAPQQPIYVQPPPPQNFGDGWYLRGQVGVAMNSKPSLEYTTETNATLQHNDIADSSFIGGGVGYEWNNWLRFDATAEYRAKSQVNALVTYPPGGIDQYQGYLKSWVFLANAYVDLGTWECFTPFIGFGVGGAYNTLSDFTDVNPNGGYGFGRNPSEWHFAYALHAGVAYNVSKNLKIEMAYRYLNYGSITDTVDCSVTCTHDQFKFDKLTSQDIMLSFRWSFCCDLPPPEPRYVYTPPAYTPPPPLRSRG
ncbi:MAG TPA: outer membrane beta-barrel protein [Pseudolabrys sp.]|jgi:opacity protein-like surface antigen|nr:outer membrane beta-barrel protein [Pseudolabrys sp.]